MRLYHVCKRSIFCSQRLHLQYLIKHSKTVSYYSSVQQQFSMWISVRVHFQLHSCSLQCHTIYTRDRYAQKTFLINICVENSCASSWSVETTLRCLSWFTESLENSINLNVFAESCRGFCSCSPDFTPCSLSLVHVALLHVDSLRQEVCLCCCSQARFWGMCVWSQTNIMCVWVRCIWAELNLSVCFTSWC